MKISKIVCIDNNQIFRTGIKELLSSEKELNVIATGVVEETTLILENHRPDILIIDIDMTSKKGQTLVQEISRQHPFTKIIIFSIQQKELYVTNAITHGAIGYILKDMSAQDMIKAVRIVAAGGSYIHPKALRNFIAAYNKITLKETEDEKPRIIKPLHIITNRECAVLQLLADGSSNRTISTTLYISEKTVKNHVSNILQKLGVKDRTQAVLKAIKNNWVELT